MWEKLISLIGKMSLSIIRIESKDISMLEVFRFKLYHYSIMQRYRSLAFLFRDIRHCKSNNQIIIGMKTNMCNGSVEFNYQLGYYVTLKMNLPKKFCNPKDKNYQYGYEKRKLPIKNILKNNL